MGYLPSDDSVFATKKATERTLSLISKGKNFNLDDCYDYARVLMWMKESHEELSLFPEEQDRFALFCLNSYAFPKNRVQWGLQILGNALQKLRHREEWGSPSHLQKEQTYHETGL